MRLSRRSLVAAAGMTAVAATAAACSSGGSGADGGSDAGGAAADADTLVVYTNSNAEGRDTWLTEKAKEQGITIQLVAQGGGDTTNKLIAEKANPIADVVFGLNHMFYEMLRDEDILEPYEPSWSGEYEAALGDPTGENMFSPLVQQGIVLAYNTAAFSEATAPQDWTDLGSVPEYNGRYQCESGLGGATTRLVVAGIVSRFRDDAGEGGVSEAGWKVIQDLWANGSPAQQDVDLYARMEKGEVDMGQMFTSGIPGFEETYSIESDVVRPEVGVPFAVEQVAVIKGTPKADLAHKFIDWFGSAETQAAWSKEFNSMPANNGAIEQADPSIVEFHKSLKQQELDWTFVRENVDTWIEKIELEYLQ